jgi:hypothetical protein
VVSVVAALYSREVLFFLPSLSLKATSCIVAGLDSESVGFGGVLGAAATADIGSGVRVNIYRAIGSIALYPRQFNTMPLLIL